MSILSRYTKYTILTHCYFYIFYRLPKGIANFASYLLDKYQLNYQEMVKDEKNYDQETWKQFRAKIRKFMSIPEQFNKYLESRNLSADDLNWTEYSTDDE